MKAFLILVDSGTGVPGIFNRWVICADDIPAALARLQQVTNAAPKEVKDVSHVYTGVLGEYSK